MSPPAPCPAGSSGAAVRPSDRPALRIHLDPERCQGHSRCYSLAPDLFDVDDDGFAFVRIDGDVPAHLRAAAELAAANCPERAITIEEGR